MIKTVIREHHWTPDQIGVLSLFDEDDHSGLEFWYNDVISCHKELEESSKRKK